MRQLHVLQKQKTHRNSLTIIHSKGPKDIQLDFERKTHTSFK